MRARVPDRLLRHPVEQRLNVVGKLDPLLHPQDDRDASCPQRRHEVIEGCDQTGALERGRVDVDQQSAKLANRLARLSCRAGHRFAQDIAAIPPPCCRAAAASDSDTPASR